MKGTLLIMGHELEPLSEAMSDLYLDTPLLSPFSPQSKGSQGSTFQYCPQIAALS